MKHLRQWMKKALAYTLVATLMVPMLAGLTPIQANAEQNPESNLILDENTDSLAVEGTNSIGSLLAEEINASNGGQSNGEGYSIFGLTMENNVATVEYAVLEDCTLLVSVYDEATGQMAGSGTAAISADYYSAEVTVEAPIMPEYFIVKAYMVDSTNMKPLRSVYENTMYTQDMQELMKATVDDFDPERVLNLDADKTTNFLVYGEDTIRITADAGTNVVTSQGADSDTYTVENITEDIKALKAGNIVAIGSGADVTIVKIKKITIEGTKATIVEGDVELEEIFECVKIENESDSKEAEIDPSTCGEGVTYLGKVEEQPGVLSADGKDDDDKHSFYLDGEFKFNKKDGGEISVAGGDKFSVVMKKTKNGNGKIEGEVSIGLTAKLKFYLTKKRQFIEFEWGYVFAGNIKIEGSWDKTSKELMKATVPTSLPGLTIVIKPKAIFKISGGAEFSIGIYGKNALKYDSESQPRCGFEKVTDLEKLEISASVTLGFGLALEPSVNMIHEKVASIKAEAEALIEGKVSVGKDFVEVHSCAACVTANLGVKLSLNPEITIVNNKVPIDAKLEITPIDLGVCYYSLTHKQFGWGECPYKENGLYHAEIKAKDRAGNPLAGVTITINGIGTNGVAFKQTCKTDISGTASVIIPEGKNVKIVGSKDNYKNSSRTIPKWVGTQRIDDLVLYDYERVITDSIVLNEGANVNDYDYSKAYIKKVIIEDDAYVTNKSVFSSAVIEKIVIKDGVTKIPDYLFYNSNIKEIEIPESVTEIGQFAFYGAKLPEGFQVRESVKKFGSYAFSGSGLQQEKIVLDEGSVMENAFSGLTIQKVELQSETDLSATRGFEGVTIEKVIIKEGLTRIPDSMFSNSTIKEIEIPGSITEIGQDAFYGAKLPEGFQVGESVKKFGSWAFKGSNLQQKKLVLDEGTVIENAFSGLTIQKVELQSETDLRVIRGFEGVTIEKVIIWEGVTKIPDSMFSNSTIKEIEIPGSVTEIGSLAFYGAKLPEGFQVGEGVTKFGHLAFKESRLQQEKIVLDEGTVMNNAFNGLTIKEVELRSETDLSAARGFEGVTIEKVIIKEGVTNIPYYLFFGSTIKEIEIADSVTKIGQYAFQNATLPDDFSISDSVTVGYRAFEGSTYNYIPPTGFNGAAEDEVTAPEQPEDLELPSIEPEEAVPTEPESIVPEISVVYEEPIPVYQALPTVTQRTAKFTGLRPNDTYNFYSVKANYEFMSMEEIMAPENILYVTQVQTDANGTATITYLPREEYDSPVEFAKCMSRYDISDVKVQQEDIIYDGTQKEIMPVVVYEGQQLAEYADYDVVGDFQVTDKGMYTIYIVGKNDYCGAVKVDFKVYSPDDNPFADVKESGWEYPFVKAAYDNKLMSGKSKDENGLIIFDPSNYMTRAEFVQTLYNKEGKEEVTYTARFTDVPDNQWYTDAILWAAENNIVAGKGDKFDVSGKITREEMATILYKYATNYKGYETAGRAEFTGYTDASSISNWATENMKWALHYGIMKGKKEALAPKDNATRAECATMLSNFMKAYE